MNTGQFAGYLGRDAELKTMDSGDQVLNFSIGVSIGFGDKKKTLWVGCALWGDRAEKLAPYLLKGKPVAVCGDIDFRAYMTRDGQAAGEIRLNVQRVTFMSASDKGERPAQTQNNPAPAGAPEDFDDDIPF